MNENLWFRLGRVREGSVYKSGPDSDGDDKGDGKGVEFDPNLG